MMLGKIDLKSLPRSTQIIIFIVLVIGLAYVFKLYFLDNLLKQRDNLDAEVSRLRASVAQIQSVEAQRDRFKQEVAQLEKKLDVLKSILPAEKETPSVLRSVQRMAASSNLKILKFTPQPTLAHSFYVDWPITITVEGNYNGLGHFFEKLGQASRIINVGTLAIKGLDRSTNPALTLEATCTATTFVFMENQVTTPSASRN